MSTIESNNELIERKCALDSCNVIFTPVVYWQVFCTKKHANKARKIRHRERVKKAMQMLNNYEAGLE